MTPDDRASGRRPSRWSSVYRVALEALPAELRRKHGPAMEDLFARELEQARGRGRLSGALAGAAGVWDVARRGAYELVRTRRVAAAERGDEGSRARWNLNMRRHDAAGAHPGTPSMPMPTTAQLLRRHAAAFALAFVALTACMLALFASNRLPALSARGLPSGAIGEVLLLAIPFTAAMTIPMAVLVAVLRVFTRLGAEGVLSAARQERNGVRRLVAPVLGAAVGVATLSLVWTSEIVPRANERLATAMAGSPARQSDRTMTIGELRTAARDARANSTADAVARSAAYEVEVQKRYALAAACVLLAFAGAAIALRFPRGGKGLVIGASVVVFWAYYVCMVMGESLADRLVVSPFVAMWLANALLLAATLLAAWRSRTPLAPRGAGPVAIGG